MKGDIAGALSFYRSGMERIRSSAAAYKDEDAYISEHSAALVSDARRKIEDCEKTFCDYIQGVTVPALREAVVEHMTAQPDKSFMQTLQYYQQFGIKMDPQEVKVLAYDAAGNSLALRCLASIAEKSGVRVSFPPISDFTAIIDRLEKMAQPPLMYCPFDYLTEGVDVLPDTPLRRADGSVYGTGGRPTSTGLIISTQGLEATMKAVVEAGDTWSAAVVPEIGEYQTYKDDDGNEVTPAQQRAEDKLTAAQQVTADSNEAQQIADAVTSEQKEAEARAAKGRAYYFGSDAT